MSDIRFGIITPEARHIYRHEDHEGEMCVDSIHEANILYVWFEEVDKYTSAAKRATAVSEDGAKLAIAAAESAGFDSNPEVLKSEKDGSIVGWSFEAVQSFYVMCYELGIKLPKVYR